MGSLSKAGLGQNLCELRALGACFCLPGGTVGRQVNVPHVGLVLLSNTTSNK